MKKRQLKEKKLRDEVWEKTGWGKVASWYQNTLSSEKSTQKDLILPELLKFLPLEAVKDKRIIDLGCGTGFFLKEYLKQDVEKSLGVDLDKEILELAAQYLNEEIEEGKISLLQGSATDLKAVGQNSFDVALSIESIPNISDLKAFAKEVYRVLDVGGKLIAVVNHPAFRVPKSSDWHFDKELQKQGRVVYKYRTSHAIKIDMNPGTKNLKQKVFTTTFHRSFEEYFNTFAKTGLTFSFMKEIYSNKISETGKRKTAEDEGRNEIPMFLMLEFIKNK